ncbi:MAG: 4Fe-4S binding protein [Candidatus Cloacimonetes bacterium]|nr:4Fe-4S binding protein [Candidatus Cloacimonadota bacterium]
MKRSIIRIDESQCDGCGKCIPGCPEGALQIIDGKARLVSDLFCDGLGACIGDCPRGAIEVEEREAEPYDEARVMQNIAAKGENTIRAHLQHLTDHGEKELLVQAMDWLQAHDIPVPELDCGCSSGGCQSGNPVTIEQNEPQASTTATQIPVVSELRNWPVQLHLLNPTAIYLHHADLLICADCVPFSFPDFHQRFIKGRVAITLCPKLDQGIDRYIDKLATIFAEQEIRSITLARMEVPCCGGIETIVQRAMDKAGKSLMIKLNVISIQGDII